MTFLDQYERDPDWVTLNKHLSHARTHTHDRVLYRAAKGKCLQLYDMSTDHLIHLYLNDYALYKRVIYYTYLL